MASPGLKTSGPIKVIGTTGATVTAINADGTLGTGLATSSSYAASSVNNAALDPSLLQTAEITLTNAEIKALRATPKTLVAAPGAGKVLRFYHILLELKAGANVLSESTANLAVKYTDGAGVQVSQTMEMTGFIDQAVDTITSGESKIDAIVAASAAINKALVLHNLGAGEFGGNAAADATLKVKIAYRVISNL